MLARGLKYLSINDVEHRPSQSKSQGIFAKGLGNPTPSPYSLDASYVPEPNGTTRSLAAHQLRATSSLSHYSLGTLQGLCSLAPFKVCLKNNGHPISCIHRKTHPSKSSQL
ncbi:hypothetical protein GOBAR_AA31819 [Gossypium barbadense]|uniref:Uncharacterized protein n=1 Tax=Gossypium barbadense TaxID=3634 RepID=A0A2P5WCQ0_GOSBA|nr:hypothetical protein GOBAR_AA31819 [Gossypium barbadense]